MLPRIKDVFLDSVVYMYESEDDASAGVNTGGSGFLVGMRCAPAGALYLYVVTNRHVIQGGCCVIRMISRSRPMVVAPVDPDDWFFPEAGDDLAVWPYRRQTLTMDQDFACIHQDLLLGEHERFAGVGDDCFMVGRFVGHDGRQRNLPSARFGNISMMPMEPVKGEAGVLVDAFLVETRSQAGYSGSPVFVYHEETTVEMPIRPASAYKPSVTKIKLDAEDKIKYRLLGVDFAHAPKYAAGHRQGNGQGFPEVR